MGLASRLPTAGAPIKASRIPQSGPRESSEGLDYKPVTHDPPQYHTISNPSYLLAHLFEYGSLIEVLDLFKKPYMSINEKNQSILDNLIPCEINRCDMMGRLLLVAAMNVKEERKRLWYFCKVLESGADPLLFGRDGWRADWVLEEMEKGVPGMDVGREWEEWRAAVACRKAKKPYLLPLDISLAIDGERDKQFAVPPDQMIQDADEFFSAPTNLKRPGATLPSQDPLLKRTKTS